MVAGPQLYELLAVLGFGLLLPPIATLHARLSATNAHAAILASLAAAATSISGAAALLLNDLEPEALLFLGTWWWVFGKFEAQRGAWRPFGTLTMALAVLAYAALLADLFGVRLAWQGARLALAAWLVALAYLLGRDTR